MKYAYYLSYASASRIFVILFVSKTMHTAMRRSLCLCKKKEDSCGLWIINTNKYIKVYKIGCACKKNQSINHHGILLKYLKKKIYKKNRFPLQMFNYTSESKSLYWIDQKQNTHTKKKIIQLKRTAELFLQENYIRIFLIYVKRREWSSVLKLLLISTS